MSYVVHTQQSAPLNAKPALAQLEQAFGMLPNIAGALAESPVLINSLLGVFGQVHSGNFSEAQIQILLLTNAVTNACTWAVAFHSYLATQNAITEADVQAIRDGGLPADSKDAALSRLAKALIDKRGHLDDDDLQRFSQAGFAKDAVLEVIAVVAASTITNYGGSVTQPPLEAMFQAYAWTK